MSKLTTKRKLSSTATTETKASHTAERKRFEIASGEIVAFINDDATADSDWIEQLVVVYEETDAIAVGSDVVPDWQSEKPDFFPAEFYWLIGRLEPGFQKDSEEVRNAYDLNGSFRRGQFLKRGPRLRAPVVGYL